MSSNHAILRTLPRVDDVLQCIAGGHDIPRTVLVDAIRETLSEARAEITTQKIMSEHTLQGIAARALVLAHSKTTPTLRPVINATGIPLHTNLGRAPMAEQVAEHVKQIAQSYSSLEYDLQTGKRGSRTGGIEQLLTSLTGAQAACIVNNNAAAVLLALSALCQNREVVVSRGELVEIGGSFRVPDVISQGGATLHEVGTSNKTHAQDYRHAVSHLTAALLKVHTSNYKITGFTSEVEMRELTNIAREMNVLSIYDLGSGSFVSFAGEPTVQQAIADGADIICFSGDKLLGGSQCGIILGGAEHIAKLHAHPLYRALRADKLTLAALEATLLMYRDIDHAKSQVPSLVMLHACPTALKEKAARLHEKLPPHLNAELTKTTTQAGGGSLPMMDFDSWAVAIRPSGNCTATQLEEQLRSTSIPIIARIQKNQLLLDVRCINESDFAYITAACDGM